MAEELVPVQVEDGSIVNVGRKGQGGLRGIAVELEGLTEVVVLTTAAVVEGRVAVGV